MKETGASLSWTGARTSDSRASDSLSPAGTNETRAPLSRNDAGTGDIGTRLFETHARLFETGTRLSLQCRESQLTSPSRTRAASSTSETPSTAFAWRVTLSESRFAYGSKQSSS
jgi:hypothetical protein